MFYWKTKNKQIEEDSYFKWVVKYILENPVKAKIVKRYDDYDYSSAKELVGLKKKHVTDVKSIVKLF